MAHHTPIFIQGIVEWIEYDRKTASEWHRFATIDSIRQFEVYWSQLEPQVRLIKANTYHSFEVRYHPAHVQKDIHRMVATSSMSGGRAKYAWDSGVSARNMRKLLTLSYEQLFDNLIYLRWLERISKRRPKGESY